MKKVLILAALIAFTGTCAVMAEEKATTDVPKPPCKVQLDKKPPKFDKEAKQKFEKRIKLTEEQKAKAKELRQKGHEEMQPLMDQIKAKREDIKKSIDANADYKTVVQKKKELHELDKQAHEIRMKNMKEFESILTDKQKKELEKIKKEGRKKFEQTHKKDFRGPRPDFKPATVLP